MDSMSLGKQFLQISESLSEANETLQIIHALQVVWVKCFNVVRVPTFYRHGNHLARRLGSRSFDDGLDGCGEGFPKDFCCFGHLCQYWIA